MKKIIIILVVLIAFVKCSGQKDDLSSATLALKACDCFMQQKEGSIDEKLEPCFSKPINDNQDKIHEKYFSKISKEEALSKYMMETMIIMIHNCDSLSNEFNTMFTNMYPEVNYNEVESKISFIEDSLSKLTKSDSKRLVLLHEKVALLTKAREFEKALIDINVISKEFSESETYFIKSYIFTQQGKYDIALEEINKSINEGNEGSLIFAELIKKKINDR